MRLEHAHAKRRTLALEVRPRSTGFVVFEGRERALDWGVRKHRVRTSSLATLLTRKICVLLDRYAPSAIVVRARKVRTKRARRRIDVIMRVMRREAKRRAIAFQVVRPHAIRSFFSPHYCTTKREIAHLIARWFPELSSKLPREQKIWKSEDHRMMLFDAAATALAFLHTDAGREIRD